MSNRSLPSGKMYQTSRAGAECLGTPAEAPTVLVVEDDPILLSTRAFNLGREGYRVLPAADGERGLAVVQEYMTSIAPIILDVMLTRMSGFHVLRQIRTRSSVPVLQLSSRGDEQDKVDGLEVGADDYVVTPFAQRELLARIRAAVRRQAVLAARPPAVVTRGKLRIEPDRRRAAVDEIELHLQPKEFGLLLRLAMDTERIFGRQDLLDAVWGTAVIVDERTVDVHVS